MKIVLSHIGTVARKLLPAFLRGREKAVVAFVVPIILAQLARFAPSLHVDPSIVEQLALAAVTSITVHSVTNSPTPKAG